MVDVDEEIGGEMLSRTEAGDLMRQIRGMKKEIEEIKILNLAKDVDETREVLELDRDMLIEQIRVIGSIIKNNDKILLMIKKQFPESYDIFNQVVLREKARDLGLDEDAYVRSHTKKEGKPHLIIKNGECFYPMTF